MPEHERKEIESRKDYLVKIAKSRFRDDIPENLESIFGAESKVRKKSLRTAQNYYQQLDKTKRQAMIWFMKQAVDSALFGIFSLIDGSASLDIDNEFELQLYWRNKKTGERLLLNGKDSIMFYELYNSEDVTIFSPLEIEN